MFMRYFRSIRWRLLIWQMVFLVGILATLLTSQYRFYKRDLIARVDKELRDTQVHIMPVLIPVPAPHGHPGVDNRNVPPRRPDPPNQLGRFLLQEMDSGDMYVAVWGPNGQLSEKYGHAPQTGAPKRYSDKNPELIIRKGCRELIQRHPGGRQVVIGLPLTEVYRKLNHIRFWLILIGTGILFVGAAVGWMITGRALLPIREISRTARTISEGDHGRRIKLSDAPAELAGLADTLNSTFDHLNDSIEAQKRFSADASHELRTPVSVVIAQTEAALKRERTPQEYRDVLQACLRAGQRMKSIVNSLLDLARLDGGGVSPEKTRCALSNILSDAVDEASRLSENHSVQFECTEESVEVEGSPERLYQAVMNLLLNAVQYNPGGCSITVRLLQDNSDAVIRIEDDGVGIPAESLPHLFDRFYRVDQSRSRENGGAGLGLPIVKSLIEAHRGSVEVSSVPDEITCFTVRLPL